MIMQPFHEVCPHPGTDEYRSITLTDDAPAGSESQLVRGSYGFAECFCADRKCDCRRVQLVVFLNTNRRPLASISYGFDRDEPMCGPFLDPLNPQSEYAEELLAMAKHFLLSDAAYVARLERHYRMFKQAIGAKFVPKSVTVLTPEEVQERIANRKQARKLLTRKLRQLATSHRRSR